MTFKCEDFESYAERVRQELVEALDSHGGASGASSDDDDTARFFAMREFNEHDGWITVPSGL